MNKCIETGRHTQRRIAANDLHRGTCFRGLIVLHALCSADMAASVTGSAQRHTRASQTSSGSSSRTGPAGVARSECIGSGLHRAMERSRESI